MTSPRELSDKTVLEEELAALVQGVAGGDEPSLAALYDATSRWVYGLALKILGDAATAEEATLDVFLQVWRSAGAYSRERGTPSSWILTIARTRAIDRLRSGAAQRRHEEPFELRSDPASPGPDPSVVSSEAERRGLVARAMGALPAEQREAIELAYFQGLTQVEIAERLSHPLGTVKTRIRLGMMKLRELLRPLEDRP